jgi:2-C-methyl-D-erythritol 4-phosphate cytidylyltransferase
VIPSPGENFKVTLPQDVARADAILRRRPQTLAAG